MQTSYEHAHLNNLPILLICNNPWSQENSGLCNVISGNIIYLSNGDRESGFKPCSEYFATGINPMTLSWF